MPLAADEKAKQEQSKSLGKFIDVSVFGARGRNRTGTTFLSRQILNLLCLPISPLGPALITNNKAVLNKSRQSKF